jgi:putative transposase
MWPLNEGTQAWAEFDHNRKIHSEIGEAPITRPHLLAATL